MRVWIQRLSILTALLLAALSTAKGVEAPIFPEEKTLAEKRVILDQWLLVRLGDQQDPVGWAHLIIEQAKLAGNKVFLLRREAGFLDPIQGHVIKPQERSLWDAECRLIRMYASSNVSNKASWKEAAWQAGALTVQSISKTGESPFTLPCDQPPSMEEDALIALGGVPESGNVALNVLDVSTSPPTLQTATLSRKGPTELEFEKGQSVPVTEFISTRLGGSTWFSEADGTIRYAEFTTPPLRLSRSKSEPGLIQQAVFENPAHVAGVCTVAQRSWKAVEDYSNDFLGLTLKAAGWQRTEKAEKDNNTLFLQHASGVCCVVIVEPFAGTLKEYGALQKEFLDNNENNVAKSKQKPTRLGGKEGLLAEVQRKIKGELYLFSDYAILQEDLGIQLFFTMKASSQEKAKKEVDLLLKGVRFTR